MDPNAAFKAIADYGISIVALVVVAAFAFWLVKVGYEDLRKQRDTAVTGWLSQMAATDKLTDAVQALTEVIRDRRRE